MGQNTALCGNGLRHPDPEESFIIIFFNRGTSFISVVIGKTTLNISVSTGEPVSMESEMVRVASVRKTEISEITITLARIKI